MTARWVAFPLAPNNPVEGIELERYFSQKGAQVDIKEMMQRLEAAAKAEGLPFGTRTRSYNSRMAQEVGKWVEEQGNGEAWHLAVFQAYFADGLNIHQWEVLKAILDRLGLDADQAGASWHEHRFARAVDEDWQFCRQMGIHAAPTFMYQGRMLVGAQPYEQLQKLVSGRLQGGVFL